jgi:hypothetical protein
MNENLILEEKNKNISQTVPLIGRINRPSSQNFIEEGRSPFSYLKMDITKRLIEATEKWEMNMEFKRKLLKLKLEDIQVPNSKGTDGEIFEDQFLAAIEMLCGMLSFFPEDGENEHNARNRHGLLSAQPQSGKTGFQGALYNILIITGLWDYWGLENILLITGMDDNALREQTADRVELQFIGIGDCDIDSGVKDKNKTINSRVKVWKRIDLKRATENGVVCRNAIILIDEAHFGSGEFSILNKFFKSNGINWKNTQELRNNQLHIISISATNFSEIYSDEYSTKRHVVLRVGSGYYGSVKFIDNGQVNNASKCDFLLNKETETYPIVDIVKKEHRRMVESGRKKGLFLVRVTTKKESKLIEDLFIQENFNKPLKLDSKKGAIDLERFEERIQNMILRPDEKSELVVIKGALRAGITIPEWIKDVTVMIYDNNTNPASTSQGLFGRYNGYRKNEELAKFTNCYVNKQHTFDYKHHVENNYSRDTVPSKSIWKDKSELDELDLQRINNPTIFNKETDVEPSTKWVDTQHFSLTKEQVLYLYDVHENFEHGRMKKSDLEGDEYLTKGTKNRLKIEHLLNDLGVKKILPYDFMAEPYIWPGGISGVRIDGKEVIKNKKGKSRYSADTMTKFINNPKPGGLRTDSHSHFKFIYREKFNIEKHLGKRGIHMILLDDDVNNLRLRIVWVEFTQKYRLPDLNSNFQGFKSTTI